MSTRIFLVLSFSLLGCTPSSHLSRPESAPQGDAPTDKSKQEDFVMTWEVRGQELTLNTDG